MDEGDHRPLGIFVQQPVEQGRSQQVGVLRAVGVDVGQTDQVEIIQCQRLALTEMRDAGLAQRAQRFGIA